MAVFTLENTIDIGNRVKVYDANGLWYRYSIECDTETGRIVQHKTDADGNFVLDGECGIEIEEIFAAAPLLVVPVESEN